MKVKLGFFVLLLSACASRPLPPPYPAYIAVDELPAAFVASLPGVRAKQLSLDPRTQRVSYRLAVRSRRTSYLDLPNFPQLGTLKSSVPALGDA